MTMVKMFIDTHDKDKGSFPDGVAKEQFLEVFSKFEQACVQHDVMTVHAMVNLQDGRMFCVNLARDAGAIESAHQEIGLPYDSITEVTTASPRDLGLQQSGTRD